MRFPYKDGKPDREESVRMIRRAFELGVNFIDSAVEYCDSESESIVGEALKGWPDRVYVSTKNHYRGTDEKAWWKNLENSLLRLDVDCIDLYNIHGVGWKDFEKWGQQILSWLAKAKDQGLIRHIGCSFHDSAEALQKVAATEAFSSIILQYNYLYRDLEPAFEEVAARDIGIIVMGPVGGGQLAEDSAVLRKLIQGAESLAEIALRYVLSNPHVTAAISGMSEIRQVEENCAVGGRSDPLTQEERDNIHVALDRLKGLEKLYCTGCRYCLPCPSGVDIPAIFKAVNKAKVYGLPKAAKEHYGWIMGRATHCIACGACETKCPQKIPIRGQMVEAAELFDDAYGTVALAVDPVRRTGNGIEFRARLHNLSDQPGTATVHLSEENGYPLEPGLFDVEIEQPFQETRRSLAIRVPETADRVSVKAEIRDRKGERSETVAFQMGTCLSVGSMEALCGRTDGESSLTINRKEQIVEGEELLNEPYVITAWPAYTPEEFLLRVRVKDGDRSSKEAISRLGLGVLLDFRPREGLLPVGFQDGVFLIRFATESDVEPKITVRRGSLEVERVRIVRLDDPDAVETRIAIPWEALGNIKPTPGRAIGFDLECELWNAEDQRVLHTIWSALRWSGYTGRAGTLFFGR
jgi:hypothetical protein